MAEKHPFKLDFIKINNFRAFSVGFTTEKSNQVKNLNNVLGL